MSLVETTPRAGDNSRDPHAKAYADIEARIAALASAGDVWESRVDFSETDAEKANDFITGAKRLKKEADEARKLEKEPHLQAGRDVDAKWKKFETRIDKIIAIVSPKLAAFLRRKQEEERAAAEAARREAREAEAAANAARMDAANAANASARMEAEERADEHARLAETKRADAEDLSGPTRVESATGLANRKGLRTVRRAQITSLPQALAYFSTHNRVEVEELLLSLANAAARHGPTTAGVKMVPKIPGIAFVETQEL